MEEWAAAVKAVLPKATIIPTDVGFRVRVPGNGRGKTGGPWALVSVRRGVGQFQQGLVRSAVFDNPAEMARAIAAQMTLAKNIRTC